MHQIKTFNNISSKGLDRFPLGEYLVSDEVSDAVAILLRSHPLNITEVGSKVCAIVRAGAGTNNIPLEECSGRGIAVFNTPGANANSVKELVLTSLLISARDIVGGITFVKSFEAGVTEHSLNELVEVEKKKFKGQELTGKILGVVGLGSIGSMVARAGLDLGMQVIGYDPALSVEAAWRVPAEVERMNSLSHIFAKSDFISLHVPLLDETRGMINQDVLASVNAGCVILNFAREPIVDNKALRAAMDKGLVKKYISDFPVPEFLGDDRVMFTPHLGASTQEAEENCAVMAVDQLVDFLKNGNISNSVNFPPVSMPPRTGDRLAIVNKNVPGMLGKITSVLASKNVNVADLINKSRGDLAYNLIDIEQAPNEGLLRNLSSLDSVMSVRSIRI